MNISLRSTIFYFAILLSLVATITVWSQTAPGNSVPTQNPPLTNRPPVLDVGGGTQVKVGATASIATQIGTDPLTVPLDASFFSDGSFMVNHRNYTQNGVYQLPTYGFTTNGPISINGIYSVGNIETTGSVISPLFVIDNLRLLTNAGIETRICANKSTGLIEPCSASFPTASVGVSLSFNTGTPKVNYNPTINWTSTNTSKCIALEGPGFVTSDSTSGSVVADTFFLDNLNETQTFTVGCTLASDKSKMIFASAVFTAGTSPSTPVSVETYIENVYNNYATPESEINTKRKLTVQLKTGTPSWCKRWTTWDTASTKGPTGEDTEWPGTATSKSTMPIVSGTTNYMIDVLPVATGYPQTGWRAYYIECGDAFSSDVSFVTLSVY